MESVLQLDGPALEPGQVTSHRRGLALRCRAKCPSLSQALTTAVHPPPGDPLPCFTVSWLLGALTLEWVRAGVSLPLLSFAGMSESPTSPRPENEKVQCTSHRPVGR